MRFFVSFSQQCMTFCEAVAVSQLRALVASPRTVCHQSSLCDERRTKAKRNINSLRNMKFNVCCLINYKLFIPRIYNFHT